MTELYKIFKSHPNITTDSRRITPDSLFFALKGESFDGNKFALSALDQGAAFCVVDDPSLLEDESHCQRLILVDDVLTALQNLAREHRQALAIPILAITGSNGKTTTKELIAAVLSQRFNLYATRGNLNNHIGVPLTLLSMDHTTEFGVVEMGASSCGEIALLCSITEPNFGVVTNIGRAHLDGFGGVDGVRKGKGELADYLLASGGELFVAVENEAIQKIVSEREGLITLPYSYDVAEGLKHNLEGEYNRFNVATAVAIATHLGVDKALMLSAIASYTPTNNRSQRAITQHNTLLLDCYNANPSSMELSIDNFARESFPERKSKIMILGDMLELGEWSHEEHRRVIEQTLRSDAQRIILVGKNFSDAALDDPRIELFESRKTLESELSNHPITDCAILIKGSRGIGLESLCALL